MAKAKFGAWVSRAVMTVMVVVAASCSSESIDVASNAREPAGTPDAAPSPPSPASDAAASPLDSSGANDASIDAGPTTHKVRRGVNMFTVIYMSGWNDFLEPQSAYDFLGKRGLELVRLPFWWSLMQPTLQGPLDAGYLAKVKDQIAKAANAGMVTVLDLHDYGSGDARPASAVGTAFQVADFADVWARLSAEFKNDPRVVAYDLQNEPNEVAASTWQASSQAAAKAIRDNGDQKLLWLESINWSAAQDFDQVTPWINDPNVMYSAHQYFEYSGTYGKGFEYGSYATETSSVLSRLKVFTDWCKSHSVRCGIGEVGWPSSRNTASWQQWNDLAETWYQAADAANLWVTYWTATSVFDEKQVAYDAPTNSSSAPVGISVAETQSLVIEKHGSF